MAWWLLLALSYALFHSLVPMLDKVILKNKKIDPMSLSAYRFLANSIIAGVLLLVLGKTIVISNVTFWVYIFIMAMIYTISALAYFFAVKSGDISKIIPIGQGMTVFLGFLFAVFLLQEVTSMNDLIGTLGVVVGGYIILTNGKIEIPRISKELIILITWAVTLALWGILSKYATGFTSPSALNFFMYAFSAFNFFVINSVKDFKRFSNVGKTIASNNRLLGFTLISSFLATVGTFLLYVALSTGKAAEILPVSRSLPLFTVLLGWLILKEKHSKIRLIGSLLIVLGIFLIYW